MRASCAPTLQQRERAMFADEFDTLLEEARLLQCAMQTQAEFNFMLADENFRLVELSRVTIRRSRALLDHLNRIMPSSLAS